MDWKKKQEEIKKDFDELTVLRDKTQANLTNIDRKLIELQAIYRFIEDTLTEIDDYTSNG